MAIQNSAGATSIGTISLDLVLNNTNFRQQLNGINSMTTQQLTPGFSKLGKVIAMAFSAKVVLDFGKACTKSFETAEQGAMKLYATLSGQGMGFNAADNFISKYVEDGLVSLAEAQTAYANLAAMGMDTSQIENIMNTLKDSASVARQTSYTIGQAITTATSGMKQGLSNVVDNAGIDTNLSKMEEAYKKLYGITRELTQEEKNAAYEMGVLNEGAKYAGSAEKMTERYSGSVSRLKAAFEKLKVSLGSIISHVLEPINNALTMIINKLNVAAEAFANFLNKVTGTIAIQDMFSGAKDSVDAMGESVENATDAIGGAAASAAEEIAGSLAPIDMLNTIDSGTKDSGAGGGGLSSTTITPNVDTTDLDKEDTLLDKINDKISLMKQGFEDAFHANPQKLIDNLGRIKDTIGKITSQIDFSDLGDAIAYNFGRIIGGISSMIVSLVVGITGGIANALEGTWHIIVDWINTIKTEFIALINQVGDFVDAWSNIFTVFEGRNFENLLGDIISAFEVTFMGITELCAKLQRDLFELVTQPIIDNQEKIKSALDSLFGSVSHITEGIWTTIYSLMDDLNTLYDDHIRPLIDELTETLSEWVGVFLDNYNKWIAPTLEKLGKKSQELFNKVKPILTDISEAIGDVIDIIKIIWNTYLRPLVSWIISKVVPIIGILLDGIGSIATFLFGKFLDSIRVATTGIKIITSVLKSMIQTTADVWNKLVEMKNALVDAFTSIPDAIKQGINGAISLINGMIDSVNKLSIDIPETPFSDSKHIGFNIGHIPLLANGGYFTKYNPQLAVIGEGQYNEVVANTKQLDMLGQSIVNGVLSGISQLSVGCSVGDVNVYLGNKQVTDLVVKEINKTNTRLGKQRI